MAEELDDYTGTKVSSLCHWLSRPIVMTGLFRDHLVRHFQEGMIEDNALRHLLWKNGLDSAILVWSR
jgi:hypothetical protein